MPNNAVTINVGVNLAVDRHCATYAFPSCFPKGLQYIQRPHRELINLFRTVFWAADE
jgi:hypothetical protein